MNMQAVNLNTEEQQVDRGGLLNISAEKYYVDTLRPKMTGLGLITKADGELIRTLEKSVNAIDGLLVNKPFTERVQMDIQDVITPITDVVNEKNGYYGKEVIRALPEKEKDAIRALMASIYDFMLIVKSDMTASVEEPKEVERMLYKPSIDGTNGTNIGYETHNMKALNENFQKKNRIPNI